MLAAGWTLSNHHHLSTRGRPTLLKGNGTIVTNPSWIMETVKGTGRPDDVNPLQLSNPQGACLDAAGNLYIADMTLNQVFQVAPDGVWVVSAGSGQSGFAGDDGPATSAKLNSPRDVSVDSQGRLYIADTNNDRIRMVDLDGTITTVAGGGGNGFGGDSGLATSAMLNRPQGVFVDAEGNIFIADTNNHRVRKVNSAGIISTYAGTGLTGTSVGDEYPATDSHVRLASPRDLALDTTGNLYVSSTTGVYRVRKIDTAGIISTVAGTGTSGTGGQGDGGLATETGANLQGANSIAVDRAGNLYISEDSRIRRVDVSGIIDTWAGTGQAGYTAVGDLAQKALLGASIGGLAVDSLSNIYISDANNHVMRRVSSSLADFAQSPVNGEYVFAESNGTAHVMNESGIHLRTIDQATGKTLVTFGYNPDGTLANVTDLHGNIISIERNSGVPTKITSPGLIETGLTVDGTGHLTAVSYPDNGGYTMHYDADGLLDDISANGRLYDNNYDAFGRVQTVIDPALKTWEFGGVPGASNSDTYSATTPEDDAVSYETKVLPTGAIEGTITNAANLTTTYKQDAGGLSEEVTLPTGSKLKATYGIDPVFRFKKLESLTATMPSGKESKVKYDTEYIHTDQDGVHDKVKYTLTIQPDELDEREWTVVNDRLAGTVVTTSPEGRESTTNYDPNTLLTSSTEVDLLDPITYTYSPTTGLLTKTAVATRETNYGYDSALNLETVSNPVTGSVGFDYDAVGRITQVTQPDQTTTIGMRYDLNGNLKFVDLPGQVTHSFGYDALNRNTTYITPLQRQYTYSIDDSHRLTEVEFPTAATIETRYSLGRIEKFIAPGNDETVFGYDASGRIGTVTRGSETVTFGYDGGLVTSRTHAGTLGQAISFDHNDNFSLHSVTYAGETEIFDYDDDDLLTNAGDFTIVRKPENGLPTDVTDGTVTVVRGFDGYAEIGNLETQINAVPVVNFSFGRDDAGRITTRTETIGLGTELAYSYAYDALGRLSTVTDTTHNVVKEDYDYDAKGRRESDHFGRTYDYDDEDRLLSAGNALYSYTDDGYLTTKTVDPDQTTTYVYSAHGELRSVTLPDGTFIEYVYGTSGQRIAKKRNGVIVEKYLCSELAGLLAVFDRFDVLIARFEYADGPLPVKMVQDETTYYLAYDQVGSLRAVIDEDENIVHGIAYDSFGNITFESLGSGLNIPLGFAGGLHDRETGLVHFGFRDYDPDTGRWTAKDPIGFAGGDINLYAYCGNDPINCRDPLGLDGVFLWGSNWSDVNGDPFLFYDQSVHQAEMYELSHPGQAAHVIRVDSLESFNSALETPNIDELWYLGHGGATSLYLSASRQGINGVTPAAVVNTADVSNLNTCNVQPGAMINLGSCSAGADASPATNMAQTFANHFNVPVRASTGGVAFGLPISNPITGRRFCPYWIHSGIGYTFKTFDPETKPAAEKIKM